MKGRKERGREGEEGVSKQLGVLCPVNNYTLQLYQGDEGESERRTGGRGGLLEEERERRW